jgi:hypothetical protein
MAYYCTFSFDLTLVFKGEALFPKKEGFHVKANFPNL